MKILVSAVIFIIFSSFAAASRILFLFPSPSKSHVIVAQGLATELAKKGHQITMISPFPLSKPMKNYRDIKMTLDKEAENFGKIFIDEADKPMVFNFFAIFDFGLRVSRSALDLPETKKMMKEETFDLVVIGMFANEFLLGVADHFKCPSIMLSAQPAMGMINELFGNPPEVATTPHTMNRVVGKMKFFDRLKNYILYLVETLSITYLHNKQRTIYGEYFPSDRYRSFDDSLKNLSLVLLNSHFSQNIPRSQVPAMIEVGGLTVNPTQPELPKDVKTFLDEAKHGAILFSFGTNAQTSFLPKDKIESLLKAFSKLKQRVVMKWESDVLEGKPENVFIGKWLPQDAILAHKNMKLFISHCGLGGIAEARYHGVPILGIPLMGDQPANLEVILREGWAVHLKFGDLNEKTLSEGIAEILGNSKYSSTASYLSNLYRDRPLKARENAVFWVEYVIRHRGAPHLQHPSIHQNFIEKNSYDVILTILLIFYISFKLWLFVTKTIIRKFVKYFTKKSDANSKKKL